MVRKILAVSFVVMLIISISILSFYKGSAEGGDSYYVYGLIEYINGEPIPNNVTVTLTNENTNGVYTTTTYTSGTNVTGFYYVPDVYIIPGTDDESGNIINVSVSYAGNTGYTTFVLGSYGGERKDITISGNLPPDVRNKIPNGTTSDYTGVPLTYSIKTTDPEGDKIKYYFDWGDGTGTWTDLVPSGTDAYATHSWSHPGNYSIRVRAMDEHGAELGWKDTPYYRCSHPLNITVLNRPPIANFTYTPSNPITRSTITFTDTSSDHDTSIGSWLWDFGDGNTSTQHNPTHQYQVKGTYTVTLTVTDSYDGSTDNITKSITVLNSPPIANFTYSPTNPTDLDTIQFTSTSSDFDGTITNYTWDFGDGSVSYEENPQHKYADNGVYTVTLTLKDNENAINSTTKSITVLNIPPTANFSFQPSNPSTTSTVRFKDASVDSDGSIVSYYWDFGDGTNSTERNPKHRYYVSGKYEVTLTVTDDDNATDTESLNVYVEGPPQNKPPIAKFGYKPTRIIENSPIYFTDKSKDIDGNIAKVLWDFGDGTNSTEHNPIHKYAKAGTYTVNLTVIDDKGATASVQKTIYVLSKGETEQVKLDYTPKNQGKNYIVWKGDSINASDLALQIGLEKGESIAIFNSETGKWNEYIYGVSPESQDFVISPFDIIRIKCLSNKNVFIEATKEKYVEQKKIPLKYTYDKKNKTGNPGYNYIVWMKNEIIKASELAVEIDLKPGQVISKYDEQTDSWIGYISGIGLEGTPLDFIIEKWDVICIKVSEEKVLI
ncbi:MAG: PKD domain-containing protein [Thermoplasmata archaeon]|nr:PKD domain-containing protein [Thermoplasmata archaeon]